MPKTLFDKIWEAHEVAPGLLYIDLHLVHEVTSPQAFDGLRLAGRTVRRPDRTLATADHNTPTDGTPIAARIKDELSRVQVETLERNCAEFGVPVYSLGSDRQGIVHVIGPELGVTQPGMTIVCGDSHTATHGAFGALAFGIGTSEVEHVLATQCLVQHKPRSMRIRYEGELGFGVTAKDLILGTIGQMGVGGATGHVVEYAGPAIEALSMEGRMTVCNMTIEGGGRAGMIAPDETTFAWFERASAPARRAGAELDEAIARWRELRTDDGATFDTRDRRRRRGDLPAGHLGHEPGHGRARSPSACPRPRSSTARRPRGDRARARLHGPRAGHADRGDRARPRVHRLVHELAHRRPARRRRGRRRAQGRRRRQRDGRARLPAGQGAGRGRGPRRGLPRRRLRLARRRLLDVPGHEPRHRSRPASAAPRPPTATSRAARAAAGAPTSSPRRWPPPPRSRATSSTSGTGAEPWSRSASSQARSAVLDRADVDTDQIMPKQFLKRVERTGFGEFLFYDWAKEPGWDLPANPILVAGENFGCGSSREHAPWGLRGLRLPGDRRAELRRHLLLQLHEDRAAAGRARRGRRAARSPQAGAGEVDLDAQEVRFGGRRRSRLRDRPRDPPPAAQRARRHRADARSRSDAIDRLRGRPRARRGSAPSDDGAVGAR